MPQQRSQSYALSVNPPAGFSLSLAGGWRINQPYCKGGLAVDFATMRAWTAGHAQDDPSTIRGYDLPTMGAGTNSASWPQVSQARNYGTAPTPPGWSGGNGQHYYTAGLMWRDGLLWTSGRGFYASTGSYPDTVIRKYSLSGATKTLSQTVTLAGKPLQSFGGGFVKGHPTDVLAGNGGYESGQDAACGPCWCKIDGTVVNSFGRFDSPKELREKRDNNYSCSPSQWFVPPDGSVGYWIAGNLYGGGLYLRGKTCFWPQLATGPMDYSFQGSGDDGFGHASRPYLYRYGSGHFAESYAYFPTPGDNQVQGCEVNAAADKVYLLVRNAWVAADPAPLSCCYNVV